MGEGQTLSLSSSSPEQTRALGRALGALLPAGSCLGLRGELGAGKTAFASGVGEGLGVGEPLRSPSYLLCAEHQGRVRVLHLDAYFEARMESLLEEGLAARFDEATVVLVEWVDRLSAWWPADRLDLSLQPGDQEECRNLILRALGPISASVLADFQKALNQPPEPRVEEMDSGMDPSGDLLVRCQQGDPDAFDLLVLEMAPRLKGYFLRQGADAATAEDLAQNVFVRTLQHLDRYQPSGQMGAYLLRIARNLWIDHLRRNRKLRSVDDLREMSDARPGPLELAGASDRAAQVRLALAGLDQDARELLELAVLQRLPYKDVADLLGVPVGTVKSRVFYALRRLRDRLAPLEGDSE